MPAGADFLGTFKAHLAAQAQTRPAPPAPTPKTPTREERIADALEKVRRSAMPQLPRFAPVVEAFQVALAAAEQSPTPGALTALAAACEAIGECHLETNNLRAVYPPKSAANALKALV